MTKKSNAAIADCAAYYIAGRGVAIKQLEAHPSDFAQAEAAIIALAAEEAVRMVGLPLRFGAPDEAVAASMERHGEWPDEELDDREKVITGFALDALHLLGPESREQDLAIVRNFLAQQAGPERWSEGGLRETARLILQANRPKVEAAARRILGERWGADTAVRPAATLAILDGYMYQIQEQVKVAGIAGGLESAFRFLGKARSFGLDEEQWRSLPPADVVAVLNQVKGAILEVQSSSDRPADDGGDGAGQFAWRDEYPTILMELEDRAAPVKASEFRGKRGRGGLPPYDRLLDLLGEMERAEPSLVRRPHGPRSGWEISEGGKAELARRGVAGD